MRVLKKAEFVGLLGLFSVCANAEVIDTDWHVRAGSMDVVDISSRTDPLNAILKKELPLGEVSYSLSTDLSSPPLHEEEVETNLMGTWVIYDGELTIPSINDPVLSVNNPPSIQNTLSVVPIPASLSLLSLAICGFGYRRKSI